MRPVMPLCTTTPVSCPTTSNHPCSQQASSTQWQVCILFGCQIDLRTPPQPSSTENSTPSTSETSTPNHPSTTSGSSNAHAMAVDIDKDGYVDDDDLKVPSPPLRRMFMLLTFPVQVAIRTLDSGIRELDDFKISSSAWGYGLLSPNEYTQMMSEHSYSEEMEMSERGVEDNEESWMDDFDASSIDTIYEMYRDKVRQSCTVSNTTDSVQDERKDDVWSTIEIASVNQCMKSWESFDAESKEGKRIPIIKKIEKRESITKKQKIRKQVSSGKTKRFFNSIKHLFGSKSKNSGPLSIIDPHFMEEALNRDTKSGDVGKSSETFGEKEEVVERPAEIAVCMAVEEGGEVEQSSKTITDNGEIVGLQAEMAAGTMMEGSGLTTCPFPLTTIGKNDSPGEDKENVMPILTSGVLQNNTEIVATPPPVSDTWQEKDIVVKRFTLTMTEYLDMKIVTDSQLTHRQRA